MDLNPDTVFFIVDKAREAHVKEQVSIPEEALSPSAEITRIQAVYA